MKNLVLGLLLFVAAGLSVQETKTEYLTVRVQYGKTVAGYKFELYLDIGASGSHSLSGQVTNNDEFVTITENDYRNEFKSDIDLLNYLGARGWVVISTGDIKILDQQYNTYLMERKYMK